MGYKDTNAWKFYYNRTAYDFLIDLNKRSSGCVIYYLTGKGDEYVCPVKAGYINLGKPVDVCEECIRIWLGLKT